MSEELELRRGLKRALRGSDAELAQALGDLRGEEIRSGSEEPHPWAVAVVEGLREPLHEGALGVLFLELSNQVAALGLIDEHPFASEEGVSRLRSGTSALTRAMRSRCGDTSRN